MLTVADVPAGAIESLLARYGLRMIVQQAGTAIRGSFWGESEAGIVGMTVYVRADTPIHSLLHETSHIICMSADRRAGLDRDAGGSDLEESAVCYLQLVLADEIAGAGKPGLMRDMDEWGYSFRLGSTRAWFESDAEDAKKFLLDHALIDEKGEATFQLRQ